MTSGAAAPNYHSQLAAATVDTVTLESGFEQIVVRNDDGTSRIDFTLDGSTPVVGGSDTGRTLDALVGANETVNVAPDGSTVVKLISAGTPHYSVEVVGS